MLALFSVFVRGLRLLVVRALRSGSEACQRVDPIPMFSLDQALFQDIGLSQRVVEFEFIRIHFVKSPVGGDESPRPFDCETKPESHASNSASARERRQGPTVLERREKRQHIIARAA